MSDGFIQGPRRHLVMFLVAGSLFPTLRHIPEIIERCIGGTSDSELRIQSRQTNQFDQIVRPAFGQPLQIALIAKNRRGFSQVTKQARLEGAFDRVTAEIICGRPSSSPQESFCILYPRFGKVLQSLSVHRFLRCSRIGNKSGVSQHFSRTALLNIGKRSRLRAFPVRIVLQRE